MAGRFARGASLASILRVTTILAVTHAVAGVRHAELSVVNRTLKPTLKTMADTHPASAPFDVLIVGGGSAGAVLAARLSEKGDQTVLLLEGGPAYAAWDYPAIVASSDNVGGDPVHDWGYQTQPGALGHAIATPRGRVLGGSSAINGAVALRARPEDFASWNLPGWTYEDMLPYFKKLESSDSGDPALHGFDGPLPVRQLLRADLTALQQAFVDATVAVGYPLIADFDGFEANGVGPYRMNVVNGVRVNTGMAYLTNAVRARPHLTIRPDALVDRVLFEGRRAVGIPERAVGRGGGSHCRSLRPGPHGRARGHCRPSGLPGRSRRRLD